MRNRRDLMIALGAGALFARLAAFAQQHGPTLKLGVLSVATYIDEIAQGSSPATRPVAQPTRFELVVTRNTAKTLSIAIPGDILVWADRVIE